MARLLKTVFAWSPWKLGIVLKCLEWYWQFVKVKKQKYFPGYNNCKSKILWPVESVTGEMCEFDPLINLCIDRCHMNLFNHDWAGLGSAQKHSSILHRRIQPISFEVLSWTMSDQFFITESRESMLTVISSACA